MKPQKKHTEGFTLSELLLAVAIILILAAIAIPSIITAQNNLRMAELNNAATQIANAAQTQMTAKKVAGTWYALVTGDNGPVSEGQNAKNPPSEVNAADAYYVTAEQARDSGILPALSIDEEVRSGDFVIEFDVSTATVISVFYTDGKTGFFDSPHPETTAAQDYYDEGGSRDQTARMKARPMIGYYEGTPAGATPEVAVADPIIWVDDQGRLCVQNVNLTTHGEGSGDNWFTSLSLTISRPDGSDAFVISGLDEVANTFTVAVSGASPGDAYVNSSATQVYELVARTDTSMDRDVFAIDLNDLVRVVNAAGVDTDLMELLNSFIVGDNLRVDAHVTMVRPSVPATATAFIQWPARIAKLAVYVTNPALDADEDGRVATEHIEGTYEDPQAEVIDSNGNAPVTNIRLHEENQTFGSAAVDGLVEENVEAGRQAYAGGWVRLVDAVDQQANVRTTVGAYTPQVGASHQYQIDEIWVNDQRVGYLKQGSWLWEEGATAGAFRECLIGLVDGTITPDVGTLTIDSVALNASPDILANEDGGYEVYVRTAPRTDEVQSFFASNETLDLIRSQLSSFGGASASGRGESASSRVIRQAFENEFGAPSTVAMWSMTTQQGTTSQTMTAGGQAFPPEGDLRIYYTPTPAVTWGDGSYSSPSVYTTLPNAILWLFEDEGTSFTQQPAAYVRDARDLREGVPDNFSLIQQNADFAIPTNRDELFFRVIEYCDDAGRPLSDYGLQYVPYTVQNVGTYATVQNGQDRVDGSSFIGWTYTDGPDTVLPGSLIGYYDASMSFGYVQLRAQYQVVPKDGVGLMYLEFDTAGNVSGYYGSFDGENTGGSLPGNNDIATWGYYVVVPAGSETPWYQQGGDGSSLYSWASCSLVDRSIFLGGALYDIYEAPTTWGGGRTIVAPFKDGSSPVNAWNVDIYATPTYSYAYNFDFAASVAAGSSSAAVATTWGSTASSWNVRSATQIVGYMPVQGSIQRMYERDAFRQTHDIDLGTITGPSVITFSGVFDGNGYRFYHVRPLPGSWGNEHYAGLFPLAQGATFSMVQLVDVEQAPSASGVSIPSGEGSVGCLVGYAQDCVFSECQVVGKDDEFGGSFGIRVRIEAWQEVNFGFLVGRAERCSVQNCYIQDVSLVFQSANVASTTVNFGALVGKATGGSAYAPGPSNVLLADSVRFVVPTEPNSFAVGGLVGQSIWGTMPPDQLGTFANVTWVVGDPVTGTAVPVTAAIGAQS